MTTRTRKPLTAEQKEARNARRRKGAKEARSKAQMIAQARLVQLAAARKNLAAKRAEMAKAQPETVSA